MRQTLPKPKSLHEHAAETGRLRAEFERARIDFVDADLEAAKTFLDLARLDFSTGETEHASRLLQSAERATEVVKGMMEQFPEGALPARQNKLEALNKAISEFKRRAP
jgi:hypothetical protein